MNTGPMPSTSVDKNVNGAQKHSRLVNPRNMMTQSASRSRGGRMDLNNKPVQMQGAEKHDCE